ncbi:HNH endonuclease [Mediterraneibacter gnavus]|nr:HNH endonuclease [Mediterraneibacter gnavus]
MVPESLGGEDIPSNHVLLCSRCHLDNPNVADPEIM